MPGACDVENQGNPRPASERLASLELIPGAPTTAAEVWLWHGRVPDVGHGESPWVVLRADDWPMSSHSARELAAALLLAADRVEAL
ncbi:MAG: hypothetical protein JWP40_4036 [Blastococcus sp.]|jgi:hypothetical protein|nr:hypothetical protein [Blastococcus sp.]